ncbi:MAG: hypothetical protein JWQ25_507, partial [Daejeonella sp.]|nr:hypothetical protein [Daejeonella sp.]
MIKTSTKIVKAFNIIQTMKKCLSPSFFGLLLWISLSLFTVTLHAQNAIVTENALPGN